LAHHGGGHFGNPVYLGCVGPHIAVHQHSCIARILGRAVTRTKVFSAPALQLFMDMLRSQSGR
jgi:hypothetical protein